MPCTLKRGTPIYRMMTSTPRPPPTFCTDCTSSHQGTRICHGISMPVPPIHKFRWTRDMMRLRWIVGRPCGTHDPKGRAPKTFRTSLFCNAAFALSFAFFFSHAVVSWLKLGGRLTVYFRCIQSGRYVATYLHTRQHAPRSAFSLAKRHCIHETVRSFPGVTPACTDRQLGGYYIRVRCRSCLRRHVRDFGELWEPHWGGTVEVDVGWAQALRQGHTQ